MSETTTAPTPNNMPGAPAAPAAAEPAKPAEPTETTEQTPPAETANSGLTADERAELERLRAVHKEESKWETRSKANAKKLRDLAESLGVPAAEFDPGDFDPKAEIGKLREDFTKSERARALSEVARTEGVDPDFIHGDTEDEMRASAQRHRAAVEAAVAAALEDKPAKPTTSAAPASTVTSADKIAGPAQITSRDDLKKMTPQQILAADKEGRLDTLKGKKT